jgi:hypothetical protein
MADTSETESAANKVPEINIFVKEPTIAAAVSDVVQECFASYECDSMWCTHRSPNDVRIADQPETKVNTKLQNKLHEQWSGILPKHARRTSPAQM